MMYVSALREGNALYFSFHLSQGGGAALGREIYGVFFKNLICANISFPVSGGNKVIDYGGSVSIECE